MICYCSIPHHDSPVEDVSDCEYTWYVNFSFEKEARS